MNNWLKAVTSCIICQFGRKTMKLPYRFLLPLAALLVLCSTAGAEERLRMSTTTSTQDSGLLKALLPPLEKKCNCRVDVIAVGTG